MNASVGVREVLITIDGQLVAKVLPERERKDVAQYFNNPAALRCGWSVLLDTKYANPSGMLMAKVINNHGMEHVFSIECVGDLIQRTAKNPR